MKKILFIMTLLLVMAVSLVSCIGSKAENELDQNDQSGDDSISDNSGIAGDKNDHTCIPGEPELKIVEEATCYTTGLGYEITSCQICGSEIESSEVFLDAKHTPGEILSGWIYEPTCFSDGLWYDDVMCAMCYQICDHEETVVEKTSDHNIDFYDHIIKEPTCVSEGSYERVEFCIFCAEEFSRTLVTLEKVDHLKSDEVQENVNAPSCTKEGSCDTVVYCLFEDCRKELSRTYTVLPKTDHPPKDPVKEDEILPSCDKTGSYNSVVYCDGCGVKISSTVVTVPKAHSIDEYGICVLCDPDATRGLAYTETEETCTIVGAGTFSGNNLVIPSLYNGKRVVSVITSDFKNNTSLMSVTLGRNLKSINSDAFAGCYRLVEVINYSRFSMTPGSTYNGEVCRYALEVHTGESKIEEYNGYYFYVKGDDVYLICHPEIMGDHVEFPNAYKEKSYKINAYALYGLDNVTSITIPDSVIDVSENAFYGLNIKKAELSASALLSLDAEKIVSITLTDGVIDSQTFAKFTSLSKIVLGDGVTSIGEKAFYNMLSLTSITLGPNVNSIGKDAFLGCYRMIEIINHSSLNLRVGYDEYGYIARYAYEVHYGTSKIINVDDYLFYSYNGVDYLVGYVGNDTSITLPKSYKGYSYDICKNAFYNRTDLVSVTISGGVNNIGYAAFRGCTSLSTLVMTENLKSIGDEAFYGCTSLGALNFPESLISLGTSAFSGCTAISELVIPKNLTTIGYAAFFGCKALTSVEFNGGVTIGNNAFYDCSSISKVNVDSIENWFANSFGNSQSNPIVHSGKLYVNDKLLTELVVPVGITSISGYAFYNCSSIEKVVFSKDVTSVGIYAFAGCAIKCAEIPAFAIEKINVANLREVVIISGDNVPADAFSGCTSLTRVEFADSIKTIGERAFYGCSFLRSIVLAEGISEIADEAFLDCFRLVKIENYSYLNIVAGSENYGKVALYALLVNSEAGGLITYEDYLFCSDGSTNYLIEYLGNEKSVVLPPDYNGQTYKIHSYAFYNRSEITSIVIPDSVTAIGNNAFYGCNFKSASLPAFALLEISRSQLENLTVISGKIADEALKNCVSLVNVNVANAVTAIGEKAFAGCSNLKNVEVGTGVTQIGTAVFFGCSNIESLTLPFIGDRSDIDRYQYPLGYIFGKESFYGAERTLQYYRDVSGSYTKTLSAEFYIPTSLKSVTVTKGSVSYGAFFGCSNITTIVLQTSFGVVESSAFYGCTSLSNIEIGYGIYEIGSSAFYNCKSLTSIVIPDSVTTIYSGAFWGCSSLESLTIPFVGRYHLTSNYPEQYPLGYMFGTTQFAGSEATTQTYYGSVVDTLTTTTYYIPTSLKSVTVTKGDVLYGAFSNCANITSVRLLGASSIATYSFYQCKSLRSVEFGSKIKVIDKNSFPAVSDLRSVYITDLSVWMLIEFEDYYANPLSNGMAGLYLNGELVTSVVVSDNAWNVKEYLFAGYVNLVSVEIGSNVRSIGTSAFKNCYHLVEVINRSSLDIIAGSSDYGCVAYYAKEVHNEASKLEYVGDYAFYSYDGVNYLVLYLGNDTNILLPKNYNGETYEIYQYAFYGNSNIKSVTFRDGVTAIGESAFRRCESLENVVFGKNVADIGVYAFSLCKGLKSITIDGGVKNIGACAFLGCIALESVIISDNVITLGVGAFEACEALKNVTIGNRVETIEIGAFDNCTSLETITIPENVQKISGNPFVGCSSLVSIHVDLANQSYTSIAGNLYIKNGLVIVSYAAGKTDKTFTVPSSVYMIGSKAFANCMNLETVIMQSGVTTIEEYAFKDCENLKNVTIGSSVSHICTYAFAYCTALKSITIPERVSIIDAYAFYECNNLSSVKFAVTTGWKVDDLLHSTLSSSDLSWTSTAAEYLSSSYVRVEWRRS